MVSLSLLNRLDQLLFKYLCRPVQFPLRHRCRLKEEVNRVKGRLIKLLLREVAHRTAWRCHR